MDLSILTTASWYNELNQNESGIWTIRNGACAVGAVLLAQQNNRIVLVRKASVKGYEFSQKYSLPGGLVRQKGESSFIDSLKLSLMDRAAKESGLTSQLLGNIYLDEPLYFPVTEYTVKASVRRTLVVALRASLVGDFSPSSTDHSVDEALLTTIPNRTKWDAIAPANCLIIARALAATIPASEKLVSRAIIATALDSCNRPAKLLDLPQFPDPWA